MVFNQAQILTQDLAKFIPDFKEYNDTLLLNGIAEGVLADISMKGFAVNFGKASQCFGDFAFRGLPDASNTYMKIALDNSSIAAQDLLEYLEIESEEYLHRLKNIKGKLSLQGTPSNFHVKTNSNTRLGRLSLDMQFLPDESGYSGSIGGKNFLVNRWITELPMATSTFEFALQGVYDDSVNIDFTSTINKTVLLGKEIENVEWEGNFKPQSMYHDLQVSDNKLDMKGTYYRNYSTEENQMTVQLNKMQLNKLFGIGYDIETASHIKLNLKGSELDSLRGNVKFKNLTLKYQNDSLLVKSAKLKISSENQAQMIFESPLFDADIIGSYSLKAIPNTTSQSYKKFLQTLLINQATDLVTDELKQEIPQNYVFFEVDLKNLTPLLSMFVDPELSTTQGVLWGYFDSRGKGLKWNISTHLDTIKLGNSTFVNNDFSIYTCEKKEQNGYDSDLALFSSFQDIAGFHLKDADFHISKGAADKSYSWSGGIKSEQEADYGLISGLLFQQDSSYVAEFKKLEFQILGNAWNHSGTPSIAFLKNKVHAEDFLLRSEQQKISLQGTFGDLLDTLSFQANAIDLGVFSALLNEQIDGTAELNVELNNAFNAPIFTGNLDLRNTSINSFALGDIEMASFWNSEMKKLTLSGSLINPLGASSLSVKGFYTPESEKQDLDIQVGFKDTDLSFIESFFSEEISQLKATALGNLNIQGTLEYPKIQGLLELQGGLEIDYLKTKYTFKDDVTFENQAALFKGFQIRDDGGNPLSIGGIITYQKSGLHFDLHGIMSNFLVLNTTAKDNSIYHGKGILDGRLELKGTTQKSTFHLKEGLTKKGSRLNIIAEDNELENYDVFIEFVKPTKLKNLSNEVVEETKSTEYQPIEYILDLTITPDAFLQFVLDPKTGDVIEGNANGHLKLYFDHEENSNVYGNLSIEKGKYTFNFLNLVRKEFELIAPSSIRWDGDPFEANIDIQAKYSQRTSLVPLIPSSVSTSDIPSQLNQPYPVNVRLNLKEDLLRPKFNFDIVFEEYPRSIASDDGTPFPLDSYIQSFQQNLKVNDQELNKQVFSLIALQKLSKTNIFEDVTAASAVSRSMSEFLTNQLSNLLSSINKNLEIDISLGNGDIRNIQDLQLRLSYSFFDNRLKFTRQGAVSNNNNIPQSSWSIIGDLTLEYLLDPDGSLKMKVYNRQNQFNNRLFLSSQNQNTTGISIIHSKDFNHLWRKKKK